MPKLVHRQLLQENYLQKGKWKKKQHRAFPPSPPSITSSLKSVADASTSSSPYKPSQKFSSTPPPAKLTQPLFNQIALWTHVQMLKLLGCYPCILYPVFALRQSDSASFPHHLYFGRVAKAGCKAFSKESDAPHRNELMQKLSNSIWPCCSNTGMQHLVTLHILMHFWLYKTKHACWFYIHSLQFNSSGSSRIY